MRNVIRAAWLPCVLALFGCPPNLPVWQQVNVKTLEWQYKSQDTTLQLVLTPDYSTLRQGKFYTADARAMVQDQRIYVTVTANGAIAGNPFDAGVMASSPLTPAPTLHLTQTLPPGRYTVLYGSPVPSTPPETILGEIDTDRQSGSLTPATRPAL